MYTPGQLNVIPSLFSNIDWGEVHLQTGSGNMPSFPPIACLVTITSIALGGFTSNAFIIAVIVIDWAKSRSLNSSELLLLSLSISNICCTVSLNACIFVSNFPTIFSIIMTQAIFTFWNIAMLSRFWFTAWLCVFYYIKIVNSTHSLFLWCKQRISQLLPWILLASAATSILSSVFILQLVPVPHQSNTTKVNITVMDQEELKITGLPSYITFFLVMGSSCPLLVVLFCSIVTVATLYSHVCRMTDKESNFRNLQTEAHYKAARSVLFLLFLYLLYYIVLILVLVTRVKESKTAICICAMVIMGYSPAQAAILVWVNPKLKQAVSWMLPGRKP